MASELQELLGFLSSASSQLRKGAVDIVSGLTGSEDGLLALNLHSDLALPSLLRLLGDNSSEDEIPMAAADALINLSQNPLICEKLVSLGAASSCVDIIYRQRPGGGLAISRRAVMLLVNITQVDSGVNALLQVGDKKMEGLYISKLVRSFCRSSSLETYEEDAFEYIGSILVNISKSQAGRKILLDSRRALLKQIVQQTDSANLLRKRGASGTIRNCCFEADEQLENLLSISEFLWPCLLLPVAGKKIYSHEDTCKMPLELATPLSIEREAVDDPEIRIQALEAIYLITLHEAGRKALWCINGPRILQLGYEEEDDPRVMEAYERIGSLLVSDSAEAANQLKVHPQN